MKQLSIGKKFIVSFGIVILLFFITVITALSSLMKTGNNYEKFYEEEHQALLNLYNIRLNMQLGVKNVILASITLDEEKSSQYTAEANTSMDKVKETLDWFTRTNAVGIDAIKEYQSIMESTGDLRQEILELCNQNTQPARAKAQQLLMGDYIPKIDEAGQLLNEFANTVSSASQENYNDAMGRQQSTFVIMIGISCLVIIFTMLIGLKLTRSIVEPVKEIVNAMQSIRNGELEVHIEYQSRDELGVLAEAVQKTTDTLMQIVDDEDYILGEMGNGNFNVRTRNEEIYVGDYNGLLQSMRNINIKLSDTLTQINQVAEQVSAGSDQVSSGAQVLAQGATEQASSVEELAASINEISDQVGKNAHSAREANEQANTVLNEAGESNQRMQSMLVAMNDISNSSNEIGKIIKTIEDIAFQTNILALNAAVEAARAGTAGKGFAVVADEVRNLASKSAEASKSTAILIEQSLNAVNNGKHIADETAHSLITVVNGVKKVAEKVDEIAVASTHQAEAISQLTIGVDQISSVVQNNSATSEESAASSEELSSQAQVLKELIGQFELR